MLLWPEHNFKMPESAMLCKEREQTWMSRWSDSHSGQLSVIRMVTERELGSELQRPCTAATAAELRSAS